jgi:uncharacterized Zn finger protein (UPF0148 family)
VIGGSIAPSENRSGWSEAQRAAADREKGEHLARYPGQRQCPACGCCKWETAYSGEGRAWICAGCGRAPMTVQEWNKQQAEQWAAAAKQPKPEPLTPTAARGALAAAITERDRARAELTRLEAAEEPARDARVAAEAAHAEAEAALEAARSEAAASSVAALLGTGASSPASVRAARQAVEDAADSLSTTTAALAAILERRDEARLTVARLEGRVRDHAVAVLRVEAVPAAVTKAAALKEQFAAALARVRWCNKIGAVANNPAADWPTVRALLSLPEERNPAATGCPALEAALSELQRDATASLPE